MRTDRIQNALTLVELLVVIAIIATLVAILLPSLTRARRAAQSAACLSNMRQISNAVFMYAAEQKGKLPYHITGSASTDPFSGTVRNKVFWSALTSRHYLPVRSVESVQTIRGDFAAAVQIIGVLKCPGEDVQNLIEHPDTPWVGAIQQVGRFHNVLTGPVYVSLGGDAQYACPGYNPDPANRVFSHYGFSANDAVDTGTLPTPIVSSMDTAPVNPWPVPTQYPQKPIAKVPGKTWLAFDGVAGTQTYGVVFRHPNISANFAYFDGHAETLTVGAVDGAAYGPPMPYYVFDARGLAIR